MRLRHVVTMSAIVAAAAVTSPAATGRQSAVVMFQDPVVVNGTFVMGVVRIVHDEERMARGEPCTQMYQVVEGKPDQELLAVHCKRVSRRPASMLTLALRTTDPSYRILTAYQFAGDPHAHQLPVLGLVR